MSQKAAGFSLVLVILTLAAPFAQAESAECGALEIYYTTFKSTLIPADIAAIHDIVRSEQRVVLNVSVRRGDLPVPVSIEGTVVNLLGQLAALDFAEVVEDTAIYYLASHVTDERDTLRFSVEIESELLEAPCELSFQRQYFGSR